MSTPIPIDDIYAIADERFDRIYPPEIRALSGLHWTSVAVAYAAAEFLVSKPNTRVLDLGCGPGKFCLVGALTTEGHFTGVEQRQRLAELAQATIHREQIPNTKVIHANVIEVDFSAYDAFYLFNPFEENVSKRGKIDSTVILSRALYDRYTRHVATQFAHAPLGTRVVTYFGLCDEVPICYECQRSSFDGTLKFWQKTRNIPEKVNPLDPRVRRDRWRFLLDFAAQEAELWATIKGIEQTARQSPAL